MPQRNSLHPAPAWSASCAGTFSWPRTRTDQQPKATVTFRRDRRMAGSAFKIALVALGPADAPAGTATWSRTAGGSPDARATRRQGVRVALVQNPDQPRLQRSISRESSGCRR